MHALDRIIFVDYNLFISLFFVHRFITSDIEMMDRLSPPEQTLLDKILALTASHLNESVVSRLSSKAAESFSIFEHRKMHAQPKLNVCIE